MQNIVDWGKIFQLKKQNHKVLLWIKYDPEKIRLHDENLGKYLRCLWII